MSVPAAVCGAIASPRTRSLGLRRTGDRNRPGRSRAGLRDSADARWIRAWPEWGQDLWGRRDASGRACGVEAFAGERVVERDDHQDDQVVVFNRHVVYLASWSLIEDR